MRVAAVVLGLILASTSSAQLEEDAVRMAEWRERWANFPGIGFRLAAGIENTEIGMYGHWMVSHGREVGTAITAFGPELSLSAVFADDQTYRRGTVGLRGMYLFAGMLGPCGGAALDNISYRASLDDTRLTLHAGFTFIDLVTVEYAKSTPLTSTRLMETEDLLLVRVGLNGSVLMQLFKDIH